MFEAAEEEARRLGEERRRAEENELPLREWVKHIEDQAKLLRKSFEREKKRKEIYNLYRKLIYIYMTLKKGRKKLFF